MENKYVKIGVYTLLGLGAIFGGYKLVKFISKNKNNNTTNEDEVIKNEEQIKSSLPNAPKFDENKVVKKGSKGSEVKTIQTAFNNIIEDAKKVKLSDIGGDVSQPKDLSIVDSVLFKLKVAQDFSKLPDKVKRVETIKNISELVADGVFGSKTESACKIIMGTNSTTYAKVRQKRLDFAKVYGLGNPYATK